MNSVSRRMIAVLLPLTLFALILFSLTFGRPSPVVAQPPLPPVPLLVDELGNLTQVYSHSMNLQVDGSLAQRFDGDSSRMIPTEPTSEWLIWAVQADGVKEFQAVAYHLVDRPITHLKFYGSSSGEVGTFNEIMPTILEVTATLTVPNSTDWTRVRYELTPPIGMDYIKVEFPALPIDRNPRQLGAVSFGVPVPLITTVSPRVGPHDRPVTIDIRGDNFISTTMAYLIPVSNTAIMIPLDNLAYMADHRLRASLPVTLTLGSYHLKVANRVETLSSYTYQLGAYKVMDGTLFDDLYANEFDLIIDPIMLRQGSSLTSNVQLAVHRWGGQSALSNVSVDFYNGDPGQGGILIGTEGAGPVAPYSQTLTGPVFWTPPMAGEYTIYARIDPTQAVQEANEDNNVISRTVTIHFLPPRIDDVPPRINSFLINDGNTITGDATVMLKTDASDNPGGSSVTSVFYLEYLFDQAAGDWVSVGFSDGNDDGAPDWLPYDSTTALVGQAWTLTPEPGLHYLRVWVADAFGNISVTPSWATINLIPLPTSSTSPATILQDEVHLYRLELPADQSVTVNLSSVSGDADLYVWGPGGIAVGSQETNAMDESVTFTSAVSGTYQIEVAGFTDASYTLDVVTPGKSGATSGPITIQGRPRFQPISVPETEPTVDVGVPQAPLSINQLYLPITKQ